ncbi:hypothetical protein [Kitasatospora sp. GP82]|uniref:hypothetical protein n=1 Tax=Kitasatospora sp. GP82 TaxID=3035089 RepID=UPI0024732662|nr:hypothetical protein [Kitasatospora sp. GP82]MDH6128635.1 hypothetical protein [Kitasatospora sp. GP82]
MSGVSVRRTETPAVFEHAENGLRAKEFCRALDTGLEPKQVEGIRAKLKRLVGRGILTEPAPGLFILPSPKTGT